ncbi:MAG: hypothetical protein ABJA02_06945 [Acidobacteriota bacterium]
MNESLDIAIFEWFATFLILAAVAAAVLKLRGRSRAVRGWILWLCAIIPLFPYSGLFAFQYLLTIAGHISVTATLLLTAFVLREITGQSLWKRGERRLILAGVAVGSAVVLPATFGLTRYDGYQWGYGSLPFAIVLLLLLIAAAVFRRNLAFVTLAAAVAAFELHLLASNNLWDYLIDPSLTIVAFTVLIWNLVHSMSSKSSSTPSSAEIQ